MNAKRPSPCSRHPRRDFDQFRVPSIAWRPPKRDIRHVIGRQISATLWSDQQATGPGYWKVSDPAPLTFGLGCAHAVGVGPPRAPEATCLRDLASPRTQNRSPTASGRQSSRRNWPLAIAFPPKGCWLRNSV